VRARILIAGFALFLAGASLLALLSIGGDAGKPAMAQEESSESAVVTLPSPKLDGSVSVEKALAQRRSVRTYKEEPLSLAQVSQILWAAQGITDAKSGKRTAPSPRASYLLELYLISGNVSGLPQGTYRYQPDGHGLLEITGGDVKTKLLKAAGQAPIKSAPAALVFTGDTERSRIPDLMYLEAGHAAQNVYLQAVSLELGTVVMAGFKPDEVAKALNIPSGEKVIYIMPFGKK
jgi:SagB-type dehydrogenase family enzyme